ncbi:MAG TPA: hypothetical protein VML75_17310 [Kofleriaceae bacterium]|nr:hypothetical protein [Kofleriaceae bacterium]
MTRLIPNVSLLLALLTIACGNKIDEPPPVPVAACPELRVAVDGDALTGLTHAVGIQDRRGGFLVHVFDHDQTTCEGAVRGLRTPQAGEVAVHVYAGKADALRAIGFGEHTEMGIEARIDRRPEKAGDRIAICVPEEVSFSPAAGRFAGRTVSVIGRFEAEFCGSQTK